jgi:hypothetical protein
MDDDPCRRFFLEPQETFHRRYEALRALCVEGRSVEETAAQFGYRVGALRSLICRFRAECRTGQVPPFFFQTDAGDRQVGDAAKTSTDPNQPTSRTADN